MQIWKIKSVLWWLVTGERPSDYAACNERDKQIAWALFQGGYPLQDKHLRLLNLTDAYLDRHGYKPNGQRKTE